jgi:hypothetical protein
MDDLKMNYKRRMLMLINEEVNMKIPRTDSLIIDNEKNNWYQNMIYLINRWK